MLDSERYACHISDHTHPSTKEISAKNQYNFQEGVVKKVLTLLTH